MPLVVVVCCIGLRDYTTWFMCFVAAWIVWVLIMFEWIHGVWCIFWCLAVVGVYRP